MTDMFYGLVIRGLGQAGYPDEPYIFCAGDTTLPLGTYIPIPIVAEGADVIELGNRIDPRTARMEIGDVEFPLIMPEDTVPINWGLRQPVNVLELFCSQRREAKGLLADDINSISTIIELFSRSGSAFSEGDVVWIENEAIVLGTLSSSDATTRTQTFSSCDRGAFDSRAVSHLATPGSTAGPPQTTSGYDNRVWDLPEIVGSEAYVVEYNPTTENLDVIGTYIIEEEPKFTAQMTSCSITATSVFTILSDRTLNRKPMGGIGNRAQMLYSNRLKGYIFSMKATPFTDRYGPVYKDHIPYFNTTMQIDDTLTTCDIYESSEGGYRYVAAPSKHGPSAGSTLPEDMTREVLKEEEAEFHEVLSFGYLINNKLGASAGLDAPVVNDHVLDFWLTHLISDGRDSGTYNLLAYTHGLGIPTGLIDVAGIEAERDNTADEGLASFLVFGWGGEDYTAQDVKDKALVPFRFFPHTNAEGKISVSQFRAILPASDTVTSISATNIVQFSEGQSLNKDSILLNLTAYWQYPWMGGPVNIELFDQSQRGGYFNPDPPDEGFDIDVTALGGNPAMPSVRDVMAREHLELANRPIPTYKMTVKSDDPLYEGQRVKFTISGNDYPDNSPFYDTDGSLANNKTVYGYIIEKQHKLGSGLYAIDVWGLNEIYVNTPKAIAPSFVVTTGGTNNIKVSATTFGGLTTTDVLDDVVANNPSELFFDAWGRKTGRRDWSALDEYGVTNTWSESAGEVTITFDFALDTALAVGDHIRLISRTLPSSGALGETEYNDEYGYIADQWGEFSDSDEGDIYV